MKIQKEQVCKWLEDVIPLFLTGAVIGWLYEVILHMVSTGETVNRGMLHGPWLPIYGIGCILMAGLKKGFGSHPVKFFLACVAASGILEYGASWLLEAIYHKRWWDYSEFPLNLHGRIFAGGLAGFGLAGCIFVYLVLPAMEKKYHASPCRLRRTIVWLLAAVFAVDMLLSLLFPNMGTGITKG